MIFEEQVARKPDHYPWTDDYSRAMWHGQWTDDDFTFESDKQDFHSKLTEQEKEIIVRALSAIGQIEIAVKTFWAKLGDNLPHPSIKDMGLVMANIEVIHNKAYERLLDELGLDDIFEENLKLEWMEGRVNYLRKYTHKFHSDNKQQFLYSLILFTLFVENVSLFSQFYVINWFGKRGLLKDTTQQTAYTAKEEDIHAKVGIKLINVIREEHPELFTQELEDRIIHEAEEALKAESRIIDWMVNGIDDEHLSAPLLKDFVKRRLNESLHEIGYPMVFELDTELSDKTMWFDEVVFGRGKTDFFFQRPTDYSKHNQSFKAQDIFENLDLSRILQ